MNILLRTRYTNADMGTPEHSAATACHIHVTCQREGEEYLVLRVRRLPSPVKDVLRGDLPCDVHHDATAK